MRFYDTYKSIAESILQRSLLPEDGLTESEISTGVSAVGGTIPVALQEYYAAIGNHPLNHAHNRLARPEALEFDSDRKCLVVMDENQSACVWGILASDLSQEDPTAHQGQSAGGDWHSELCTLSEFLVITLYLQCCWGGLQYSGSHANAEKVLPRIEGAWEEVVHHNGLSIWQSAGMLVSHLDGTCCLCAANTESAFDVLVDEYGFGAGLGAPVTVSRKSRS